MTRQRKKQLRGFLALPYTPEECRLVEEAIREADIAAYNKRKGEQVGDWWERERQEDLAREEAQRRKEIDDQRTATDKQQKQVVVDATISAMFKEREVRQRPMESAQLVVHGRSLATHYTTGDGKKESKISRRDKAATM